MRLATGKRIGQSRQELVPAVVFSFFLHILSFALVLFLYTHVQPPAFVPPAYRVTLVAAPADHPHPSPAPEPAPAAAPEPAPPKPAKPAAKQASRGTQKGGMAGLERKKEQAPEREYVAEDRPPASDRATAEEARPQGGVALSAPQAPAFGPYVAIVRDKIERNWNPPPGVKETKATVVFRVGRSGRVSGTSLQAPSGNFYFDQAAMRSILSSSPFPRLPDGYGKEAMDFTVDLMARE